MRTWVLLCVVAVVAGDYIAPTYTVDMDEPAETRWLHIYPQYHDLMVEVLSTALTQVSKTEVLLLGTAMKLHFIDADLHGEIQGCANFVGFDFNTVAVMQFLYEYENGCTSIVYRHANNTIVHGRNLDFPFAPLLRQMVINIDFVRGGNYMYSATTFPCYFGIISGSKPNGFSVSVDERHASSSFGKKIALIRNLLGLVTFREGDTIAIRRAFETFDTFAQVVKYLGSVPVVAPTYYIIGGVSGNEGAVITRNRWDTANYWYLSDTTWFLVETNYDHWKPQPANDDRADAAIASMTAIGQADMDIPAFLSVFDAYPVLQEVKTVYTAVMSPATGFYMAVARQNVTSVET